MANFKDFIVDALLGKRTNEIAPMQVAPNYGEGLQNYFNELPKQEYAKDFLANTKLTTPQIQQGIANGLNFGIPEIAEKQKELNINTPMTGAEIEQAKNGLFNQYPLAMGVTNTPREGGILRDLASGYRDNYNNNFSPLNLAPDKDKTIANRIGEGLGTLTKFIDSPLGRGLAAYGVSNALGYDDAIEQGLTGALTRQNAQTADKIYREQLGKLGYEPKMLDNIRGNVSKDIYEGITSGMRLNNQMMTYGQLAMFDPTVADQVAKNPLIANQFVPISYARDIYGKKRDTAESKMKETEARAEKLKKETQYVGKPKVTITRREGGTHSIIEHKGGSGTPDPKTANEKIRIKAPNGKIYNIPRSELGKALKAGGVKA